MNATQHEVFDTDTPFSALGLSEPLMKAIEALGFEHPTHVQAQLIPPALAGRDVLAQSKTGSGKTAAFGIPLVERAALDRPFGSLVLCPTRELAIQVAHDLRNLTRFTDLHVVPIYGGQRMRLQEPKLDRKPQIIVGTPGRVMDFHGRGRLPYDNVRFAVLDEVDRMLDIGFRDDIRRILGSMKQEHQTVLVSATVSTEIERLARAYLKDPLKLVLSAGSLTVTQVDQFVYNVEGWDKSRLLVHLIHEEKPGLVLVFCRTKSTVDALTEYLQRKKIDAHAIHGDLHQGKRNRVMERLRTGDLHILVASDLAARGLDVEGVTHVINFDLPEDPEVYIHRIGRTARAGRRGIAWSFVTPGQGDLLMAVERYSGVEIVNAEAKGFEPGPVPERVTSQRRELEQRRAALAADASRTTSAPPKAEEAVDPNRFPGGVVPTSMPAKRLGGRLRTRRR